MQPETKNVVTWKWKPKGEYRSVFKTEHVNTLKNMIKANSTYPINFICVTDDPIGLDSDVKYVPIWPNPAPNYGNLTRPNCFVRLKMFSENIRQVFGNKFLSLDLDTVVTGNIDAILNDPENFKIWRGGTPNIPCNGSMISLRTGSRTDIWAGFKPERVDPINGIRNLKTRERNIGSDQAWIAQCINRSTKFFDKKDGVYSFRMHIRNKKEGGFYPLPENSKLIFFHGETDPWHDEVKDLPWIKEHYLKYT